jgi:hypothetical protein
MVKRLNKSTSLHLMSLDTESPFRNRDKLDY